VRLCVRALQGEGNSKFAVGSEGLPVLFKNKVYFFASEDKLQKFMRTPWKCVLPWPAAIAP
jgi:hypothetical protein